MDNIISCGRTDTGMRRRRNEDSYIIEPEYGLFAVADGMGGHASGEKASILAVETVRDFIKGVNSGSVFGDFDPRLPMEINIISSAVQLANKKIFNESKNMGTTMVVLLIRGDKAHICNVGDSRLYRIRNNKITQLTEDHSLVADEIRKGTITKEQSRHYPLRHVITRSVGMNKDVKSDCMVENIIAGDMFLLCSDGLSGMLEDSEMLKIILDQQSATENKTSELPNFQASKLLEDCCEQLVKKANEKGGEDNITVVLVKCG